MTPGDERKSAGPVGWFALLTPAAAWAGDDDKPPAYKIYIDPETGKYTTEDPAAKTTDQPSVAAALAGSDPAPDAGTGWSPGPGPLVVIMIMLLAGALAWHRRQPAS